jgi:hypothetical protein
MGQELRELPVANYPAADRGRCSQDELLPLFNPEPTAQPEVIHALAQLGFQGLRGGGRYSSAGARKNTLACGKSALPDWRSLS